MNKKNRLVVLISVIISSIVTTAICCLIHQPSNHDRIRDYYKTVNLAEVSPHVLIERVKSGEAITIVDVRDPGAYAASHISGAINIPADDTELVAKFQTLDPTIPIVTYCYTEDCMASRQVGNILADHGIYVQHLNVGYAEWEKKEGTGDVFNTKGACPLTGAAGC